MKLFIASTAIILLCLAQSVGFYFALGRQTIGLVAIIILALLLCVNVVTFFAHKRPTIKHTRKLYSGMLRNKP